MNFNQAVLNMTQELTSKAESTHTESKTLPDIQCPQLSHYLSMPAENDPWHGLDDVRSVKGSRKLEGKSRDMRSSSPSSLRAEHGSDVED